MLGGGALFVECGLLRGSLYPFGGFPLQALAMLGSGSVAAVALLVRGDVGASLVAAGLLAHSAWDVSHHDVGTVVARSMAQFCCVLDALLALAIVLAAGAG